MMGKKAGLIAGISNEEYHADPAISSSRLKDVLKCPALYKASIDGLLPNKSTPSMDLGTVLHAMALEPETVDDVVVVSPTFSGKGSVAARAEFKEENAGLIILSAADFQKCEDMTASLLSLPDTAAIVSDAQIEMSGWYDDPETGLRCRYRPDARPRTEWCLADVKTCVDASPAGFSRAIENFGYAISAAHYLIGDGVLMGTGHQQFVFLCVESSPPYLPAIYVLNDEDLRYGIEKRAKAMATIKECTETGIWPSYNDDECVGIGVPYWAKKEFLNGEM